MQSQSPGRLEGWDPLSPPPTPASPTPKTAVNVTLGAVGKPRVSPGLTTACIADAALKSRSASVFPEMAPCFDFVTFITARVPRPRISPCSKIFAPTPTLVPYSLLQKKWIPQARCVSCDSPPTGIASIGPLPVISMVLGGQEERK